MQIREMIIQDYEAVCQLWESTKTIELTKSDELIEIKRMLERNPNTCLVGEEGGRIIGVVLGGFDGRRGFVHHLAIHPEIQRKGYGIRLFHELERRFIEMGVVKVHLFVNTNNLQAVGFYEKVGYKLRDDFVTMSKSYVK